LKSLTEAVKPDGGASVSRSTSIQQQACWIRTLYSHCVCVCMREGDRVCLS